MSNPWDELPDASVTTAVPDAPPQSAFDPSKFVDKGNINLYNRPAVKMPDGKTASVRSMSFNIDGQEILVPTVSDDGRIMSNDEAIQQYKTTGKHLGKFKSVDEANTYAQQLHLQQASLQGKKPWDDLPDAPSAMPSEKKPWDSLPDAPQPELSLAEKKYGKSLETDPLRNLPADWTGDVARSAISLGTAGAELPLSTAQGVMDLPGIKQLIETFPAAHAARQKVDDWMNTLHSNQAVLGDEIKKQGGVSAEIANNIMNMAATTAVNLAVLNVAGFVGTGATVKTALKDAAKLAALAYVQTPGTQADKLKQAAYMGAYMLTPIPAGMLPKTWQAKLMNMAENVVISATSGAYGGNVPIEQKIPQLVQDVTFGAAVRGKGKIPPTSAEVDTGKLKTELPPVTAEELAQKPPEPTISTQGVSGMVQAPIETPSPAKPSVEATKPPMEGDRPIYPLSTAPEGSPHPFVDAQGRPVNANRDLVSPPTLTKSDLPKGEPPTTTGAEAGALPSETTSSADAGKAAELKSVAASEEDLSSMKLPELMRRVKASPAMLRALGETADTVSQYTLRNDVYDVLFPEKTSAKVAERPELMTPEEWSQERRNEITAGSEALAKKHEGRSDDVLLPQIERMRKATGTQEISSRVHRNNIEFALGENSPVSAVAVDAYKIKLPDGYVREGDRYVFKPEAKPAEAGAQGAKVTDKVKVTETPSGDVKVEVPSADKPGIKPAQQKKFLMAQIDEVVKQAPDGEELITDPAEGMSKGLRERLTTEGRINLSKDQTAVYQKNLAKFGKVTIEVPGDGTFEILNTRQSLEAFRERAKKFPLSTLESKQTGSKPVGPTTISKESARPKDQAELQKVMEPFISTDASRAVLHDTHLENGTLTATDGERLAVVLDVKGSTTKHEGDYPTAAIKQAVPGYREGKLPDLSDHQKAKVSDTEQFIRQLRQALSATSGDRGGQDSVDLFIMPDGKVAMAEKREEVGEYRSADISKGKFIGNYQIQFLEDAAMLMRKTGNTEFSVNWKDDILPLVLTGKREYAIIMPRRGVDVATKYGPSKDEESQRGAAEPTRNDFNARFDTLKKLTDATGKKFTEKDIYSAIGDKHWDTMTPEERTTSLATLDKLIAGRSPETILGFGGTKTVKQPATMKEAASLSVKLTPKDKISRPIRKAVQPFIEAWDGLVKLVAPTLRSDEAEKAGSLLIEQYGKTEVEKEQTLGALRRAVLEGAKEANEKLPLMVRLLDKAQSSMHTLADSWFTVKGKDEAYKFMSNMSTGKIQPTAIARNIQAVMEHGYRQLAETIQNFGEGKLSELREHYFGTYWTPESRRAFNQAMGEAGEKGIFREGDNPNEASADQKAWVKNRVQELMKEGEGNDTDAMPGLSRRPLEGAKSFLKEKVFDDFMTAVDFGLEPVSWNPVDMFTMKIHEMQKYILAHNFYDAIEKEGWDKFLYTGKDMPEGWVQAPGPHGTVYGPPEIAQTEYVDKNVYDALMDVAKGLGVTHERVVNAGRGKLGYASTSGKMVTQAATELSVVAHELGHELDFKYGLWNKIVKNAVGVGKRGEATKTASAEKRGTIQNELRALADLTFEGQEPSDYYKSKVRKEAEKMAHMLEAYIHAPEKFRQVAPTVFADFDRFIRQTPELAKLADIKQGLALKRMDIARKIGGYPVVGSRIVPEAIGQVLKNHLSPTLYSNEYFGKFWGAYMGAANQLNRFQLGFGSQFHAGFTSMETVISEVALGAKAISKGDLKNAAKFFGKAPFEFVLNPIRGNRVLKAMQGNSPVTPEMAKVIEGIQAGWLRRSMDRRMWPESTQSMINDWVTGKPIKAIARAPLALVEQTIRPVMEWLVPRQKFGVFSETLNYWLERNPNATHDEFVKQSQHIVAILDERLGQVNYERIFANNVAKNIVQGVVRAPGWTGGTILQVGRGLTDLAGNFKDLATGKLTELSDRSAYTLSLVVVTAIANGLLTKLFTGENPDAMDLLAFRAGLKDEKGDYERFMLPTYMKDMYAYAKDIRDLKPDRTLLAKTHPAVSMLNEVNENKDYYGVEIRHKGDSLVDQFGQLAGHIVKGFTPFWIRGVQKETERGAGLIEKTLPLIGVMPARRAMTASRAEEIIDESRNRMERRTKVQFEKSKLMSQLRNKVARENEANSDSYPELDKALEEEKITGKEYKEIIKDATLPPLVRELKHVEVLDAVRVWDAATDVEKEQIQDTVLSKIYKATNISDDKKSELADKVAAFEPKQVAP